MLATLSAMSSVLPPVWRVILISAAGLPSPAMMRTWSSVPADTVAKSRTRKPCATTMFAMSSAECASLVVTMRYCR